MRGKESELTIMSRRSKCEVLEDSDNSEVDGDVESIFDENNRAGRFSSCAVDVAVLQTICVRSISGEGSMLFERSFYGGSRC
jgi:hypothetical protein